MTVRKLARLLIVSLCATLAAYFGWAAVQRNSGEWFAGALLFVIIAALVSDFV